MNTVPLLAILLLAGIANAQAAGVFHVAPGGSDKQPGTAAAPVASLGKAVELAERASGPAEIVVRGGTYPLAKSVKIRRSPNASRLVIRAAQGETPVFDGGAALPPSKPLEGSPGVFVLRGDFTSDEPPILWEEKTGRHFIGLAGIESVRVKDASATLLDAHTLAVRCQDGKPPEQAGLRVAGPMYGIEVLRDHVTLQGLHFRNFVSSRAASAVIIGGTGMSTTSGAKGRQRQGTFVTGTVVERCAASNCYVGFRVYLTGRDSVITRCRTRNTVCGVYVSGIDTTVEDCELVNDPGFHTDRLTWDYRFDRCGIRFYNGPEGAVLRRNFIRGFEHAGVHSKGSPGRFVVEHNTTVGIARPFSVDKGFVVRYNVFGDATTPFASDLKGELEAEIDYNLFWGPRDLTAVIRNEKIGGAPHNRFGDPRFAAPVQGDYRLLPGSPALGIHGEINAGAFGPALPDFQGPPRLGLVLAGRRHDQAEVHLQVAGTAPAAAVRWVIDDQSLNERPFQPRQVFRLPSADREHRLRVQVRDAQGRLSAVESLALAAPPDKPRLIGEPAVVSSRFGALISFTANQDAEGLVEHRDGSRWIAASKAGFEKGGARRPVLITGLPVGKPHPCRVTVGGQSKEGQFTLSGPPRHLYVGHGGEDVAAAGSRQRPFATLNSALERALPGDRVRLLPGAYFGESRLIGRGGTEAHPLIIEGVYSGTVVLDGLREASTLLRLEGAPHVLLRNLGFRWYVDTALLIADSPGVRVTGCRFINQYWRGGSGMTCRSLVISRSPGFVVDHCIFARTRYGLTVQDSPGGRVLNNTAVANSVTHLLWRGAPEDDLLVQYNAFLWNDNSMLHLDLPAGTGPQRAVIDHNNYGTTFLRAEGTQDKDGRYSASLPKPHAYLPSNREFIVSDRRFVNMDDWRAHSGQDKHSIFADPKLVDPAAGRFDVAADSPNRLPDGKVIGALGFLGQTPQAALDVVLTAPLPGDEVSGAFTVAAEASALDGAISKVEFLVDDRVIGQVAAAPHRLAAPKLPPGRYTFAARAVGDKGAVAVSDPVEIEVR